MSARRLRSLLLALALIVASAVLYRLSSEPQNFEVVSARVGEPVAFYDGVVSVDDVRVGTTLRSGTNNIDTTGVFVMVRVKVQAPGQELVSVSQLQLLTPDHTYATYTDSGVILADPGFEESKDVVFEVDPQHLAGMTIEASDNSFVVGYHQRLRAHLGVTTANQGDWLAAAKGQRLNLEMTPETRGLT